MKVKDLINELQEAVENGDVSEDEEVYLQRDSEGNGFLKMRGIDPARIRDGECMLRETELTPALEKQGYGEEDLDPDAEPVLILFP